MRVVASSAASLEWPGGRLGTIECPTAQASEPMQTYEAKRCEHVVQIYPDDIDHMGHVNNAVYLRWVQDAVVAHWTRRAPAEMVENHLWVALRHEITYRQPAFLTDSIIAESVFESLLGARAVFTTLIRRGDVLLTEVRSTWACLDAVSRRPSRLPRAIACNLFTGSSQAAPAAPNEIQGAAQAA
ncbi:MAG: acyl-CoA thioesterase [Sphingobium sp.]